MGWLDGIFGASDLPSSPTSQGTQTTAQTSTPSIQPWAQPYISNYLNATQNLIANQQTPELLNASYVDAKNLQLPGGFASGSALAQAGGQGSLSTAPIALQYGQQGAQYGALGTKYGDTGAAMGTAASRAGDMYAAQATSPEAMAQYMSPYMQNVVDYQKNQAVRDYQIQAPQMAASAVGSGAFGGNRLTLQQSEANRGLQNRLAGIEATGQQQAFDQARQAQQFGSQLGLQGLQAGMQGQQVGLAGLGTAMQGSQVGLQGVGGAQQGYAGATQAGGTLGNIAAQQAQAQLAAAQLKNQFGMQQQMWPYQQQQFAQQAMSNLPFTSTAQTGSTTSQGYQAPPNMTSQIAGLGTAGLGAYGLYKMFGASGGLPQDFEVKRYAEGGIAQGLEPGWAEDATPQPIGQLIPPGAGKGSDFDSQGNAGISELIRARNAIPMSSGAAPALIGSNEDYVNSLYKNILGREADQGGYKTHLDMLNFGQMNPQDLANAFRNSAEGQSLAPRMPQGMGMGMAGGMGAGLVPASQLRELSGGVGGSLAPVLNPQRSGLADIRLNQLLGFR